jgi:hypothetical protein
MYENPGPRGLQRLGRPWNKSCVDEMFGAIHLLSSKGQGLQDLFHTPLDYLCSLSASLRHIAPGIRWLKEAWGFSVCRLGCQVRAYSILLVWPSLRSRPRKTAQKGRSDKEWRHTARALESKSQQARQAQGGLTWRNTGTYVTNFSQADIEQGGRDLHRTHLLVWR